MTNRISGFDKALNKLPSAERSKLTKEAETYFRIAFDYQLEPRYNFSSIHTILHPGCYHNSRPSRTLTNPEKLELLNAFSKFVEDSITMTYTQVDRKYGGHPPDKNDTRIDDGEEYPTIHYQMALSGLGKIARVHGYIKNGLFIVTRMDWSHGFHVKKKR